MEQIDILVEKYKLIYDLLKVDIESARRRNQIFFAAHSGLFLLWYYAFNKHMYPILIIVSLFSFIISYMWFLLNKKARLFGELRKQHLREVEEEIKKVEKIDIDIFTIDKKLFNPKGSDREHTWSISQEKFPPDTMALDYEKYGRKSVGKYEEYISVAFLSLWAILLILSFGVLINTGLK